MKDRIIELLRKGLTDKQIAARTGRSVYQVGVYRRELGITGKLGRPGVLEEYSL